jgi:hypothetical protein
MVPSNELAYVISIVPAIKQKTYGRIPSDAPQRRIHVCAGYESNRNTAVVFAPELLTLASLPSYFFNV